VPYWGHLTPITLDEDEGLKLKERPITATQLWKEWDKDEEKAWEGI